MISSIQAKAYYLPALHIEESASKICTEIGKPGTTIKMKCRNQTKQTLTYYFFKDLASEAKVPLLFTLQHYEIILYSLES